MAVSVNASEEFHTKYVVNYTFDQSGNSRIEQRISLTNKLTDVYASSYQLELQDESLRNLTGFDSQGPLRISQEDSRVLIEFNDQVVGRDQTLNFTLNYDGQPANHNGQVYEILLPKLGNSDQIDDYELNLIVPNEFGKLAFISPQPTSSEKNRYSFSKHQLTKAGVVAAFGNFQTFGFDLKYHLVNSESAAGFTEIALPPDTNYQRVFYEDLVPRPVNVRVDEDGNWLARYDLKAKQNLEVTARGQAHLLAEPSRLLTENFQDLSAYLQATQYWPADDPEILALAQGLKTPQAIYDYVVNTLSYDYSKLNTNNVRLGGKQVLSSPTSAVCTEFTDLFITLARAARIPAREVNGYAYTTNSENRPLSLVSDVLHAWPQYWDFMRQTWISVDPTWENTTGGIDYFNKLDFNHFAFAIHGMSDILPISAGQYKQDANSRDVHVDFATYKDYPLSDLAVSWKEPLQIVPLLRSPLSMQISNPTGQGIHNIDISVFTQNITLAEQPNYRLSSLPPFSRVELPLDLAPHPKTSWGNKVFTVYVGSQILTYNIPIRLYLFWFASVGISCAIIIIGVAYFAVRTWSLYLQRPERKSSLRGQGQIPEK